VLAIEAVRHTKQTGIPKPHQFAENQKKRKEDQGELETCNETARIRRRHAELCCADLDANQSPAAADQMADHGRKIDDVRAALEWCFSPDGNASAG
jgi:hypothetical protein